MYRYLVLSKYAQTLQEPFPSFDESNCRDKRRWTVWVVQVSRGSIVPQTWPSSLTVLRWGESSISCLKMQVQTAPSHWGIYGSPWMQVSSFSVLAPLLMVQTQMSFSGYHLQLDRLQGSQMTLKILLPNSTLTSKLASLNPGHKFKKWKDSQHRQLTWQRLRGAGRQHWALFYQLQCSSCKVKCHFPSVLSTLSSWGIPLQIQRNSRIF